MQIVSENHKLVHFYPEDIKKLHTLQMGEITWDSHYLAFLCLRAKLYFQHNTDFVVTSQTNWVEPRNTSAAFLVRCLARMMGVAFTDIYNSDHIESVVETHGFIGMLNDVGNKFMKDNYGFCLSYDGKERVVSKKEYMDGYFEVDLCFDYSLNTFYYNRRMFIDRCITQHMPDNNRGFYCDFVVIER